MGDHEIREVWKVGLDFFLFESVLPWQVFMNKPFKLISDHIEGF